MKKVKCIYIKPENIEKLKEISRKLNMRESGVIDTMIESIDLEKMEKSKIKFD